MAPNSKLSSSVKATINKEEMDASLQRLLAHNMVNHLAPLRLETTNRRSRAFVLNGRGDTMLDAACDMLHPDLRPVPPQPNCLQSMQIYEDHRRMAADYMEMQNEMAALRMYKQELTEKLNGASEMEAPSEEEVAEYAQLKSEKEALLAFREQLASQLEKMTGQATSAVQQEPVWSASIKD